MSGKTGFRDKLLLVVSVISFLIAYECVLSLMRGFCAGLFQVGDFAAMLIADAFLLVCSLPLLFRARRRGPVWEPCVGKVSFFGWFVLCIIFLFMYVAVEMTGLWIGYALPSVGATGTYVEMSGTDLYLYLIRAVTVTPFIEEFGARYLLFGRLRPKFGFWPSYLVSALYFAFIHGTLMHIPLAIGLSFFLCILYEVTGRWRYCVAFHMFFNWCAAALVFTIDGFPVWARFALLGFSYVSLLCLYIFRKYLFGKVFCVGMQAAAEAWLEGRLERLAEKAEEEGNAALEAKASGKDAEPGSGDM